jgi:putative DNA methylase
MCRLEGELLLDPKRYIEDVLPLGELNKYAQKGGGIGSLNAMHPYFARRPLTASRAMTLAALVGAPRTEAERDALEKLLVELSSEEWPDKPKLLQHAHELIRQAHGGRAPRVLDPFAGGGSMSLEAMRLGCEATALDLNPVAYLALIASLVYPQQFNRVQEMPGEVLLRLEVGSERTCKLVEDVRYWAEWVEAQAEAQIGDCYPDDPDGAVPVTYLWAKTITCPHCGGEVPLIKRRWLQNGDGNELVAYQLNVDKAAKTYTVDILRGEVARQSKPDQGTMRGATVECIYCGMPSERERIVAQGQAGEMGQHMIVVVLYREGKKGRNFRPATDADRAACGRAAEKLEQAKAEGYDFWGFERLLSVVPDEPTPSERARSVSIRLYGITEWGHLFNDRQALAVITFGQQIRTVRELLTHEEGTDARVIALYLSTLISRYIARSSTATVWDPSRNTISSLFARHDIQMTWDYAEANPFSGQAASWGSQLDVLLASIENLVTSDCAPVTIRLGSATQLPPEWTGHFDAVICDPPYYDSVTYGDLTDYFYPWHKRIVGDDYPEAFVTEVTPKDQELVQEAIYHGGTEVAAKQFYEDGMAEAFTEMHRVLRDDGIAVIMFAHKKSSAWETLVGGLIRAGFQVTASWPLNTEGRRLQSYRAVALASSVYLVCRKRPRTADGGPQTAVGYLEDIEAELRSTIRRYLERFWAAGIGGADFFMSAIGPGLSVYSRYARVERYDGTRVEASDFLNLVRHEVAAFAIERIIGQKGFSERLDPPTQFYVLWRWGYNEWDVPDGEALLLSTAVGIELDVLMDRFGLVGKVKKKLRLLEPADRVEKLEKVPERVAAGGTVPLVDVLHKACLLWQADRQDELSALVAARGGEMWPVAQAIVELLPKDNPEGKALMSLLGTRLDLESRAQRWAEAHRPAPRVVQGRLWEDETIHE